jgi:hypothetical protein
MSEINLYGVSPFKTPLKLPGVSFDNHHLIGFSWPYTNSQGKTYHTTMTDRGWVCNCTGFTFHGKCKHIRGVHERLVA